MLRYRQDAFAAAPPSAGQSTNRDSSSALKKARGSSIWRLLIELGLVVLFIICFTEWREEQQLVSELDEENQKLQQELKDLQILMQTEAAQGSVLNAQTEVPSAVQDSDDEGLKEARRRMNELELDVTDKETQLEELHTKIKSLEGAAKQRNKALDRIRKALTEMAQVECARRFPDGPARVLMVTSEGDMEIEMAPCNLMPVVTLHFLRQVEEKFWDGMSFFRAESHVIQASDMRPDGSRKQRQKRSESIPFQEYSPDFVHHKYTLGIAGRPGGPDFYVNMLENIKIHGPGGQGHNYQGDPEADSCFAKIIRGHEVANKIQKLPFKRENGLHILQNPVEIVTVKIL